MINKLFSSKWGELAMHGAPSPSGASWQFPGADVQVATNDSGDYHFLFQEFKDAYYTVRFYQFTSNIKETYTWVSDPMVCLRMGISRTFHFQLPHLGSQVFHQRDYNLLHIPHFSTEFTLGPEASVSFMDILLTDEHLYSLVNNYPQLSDFATKVSRGFPTRFSMRNCIASTESLRWVDELMYTTGKKNIEQSKSGYITHHLIKAAIPEMISGCMNKPVKLHMADVNKIYQIAEMLESSTHTVTAKELSEQYNISSYKLEKGFKEIYGHSVLHHRYEERMRLALRLVNNNEYNSKQVAAMLGYSEPQSFSRAFRKRFGYAPYRNAPKYAI